MTKCCGIPISPFNIPSSQRLNAVLNSLNDLLSVRNMEEPIGAQYAVHIALQTLKERCKNLQQRVASLEEENLTLRLQCNKKDEEEEAPLSDVDKLQNQITELAEHKQQLTTKIRMVTNENQELWSKLNRLTHVNQNLGNQLTKINDSLVQYSTKHKEHSPLIRSKTFTQDEPHTKVLQKNLEENGKICAELEEISLKIINSFTQGKSELDSLYSEITEVQYNEIITDSCGFYYDDYDNNIMENFNSLLEELKATKKVVFSQKVALNLVLNKITSLQEIKKKSICDKNTSKSVEMVDKCTITTPTRDRKSPSKSIEITALPESKQLQCRSENLDMICPVCCIQFPSNTYFEAFEEHVEKHFTEVDTFEML